jgi:hypothetical protein
MKLFSNKKGSQFQLPFVLFILGFSLLFIVSLVAYRVESKYLQASHSKIATLQGRISELEKQLQTCQTR